MRIGNDITAILLVATAGIAGAAHAQQIVNDSASLADAIAAANEGTGDPTILLVDGTYDVTERWGYGISRSGITIRSVSGNRGAVILRGAGMGNEDVSHIFQILADDVTLQDMTLQEVGYHAIQVHGEAPYDADSPVLRNLHIRDTGEQIVKVSYIDGQPSGSDGGLMEDCLLEFTAGIGPQYYIGGIDAHNARDWVVRRNTFRGIRSPSGSVAEYAVHFWSNSANTIVERNLILNCDRGIGFGLGTRGHSGGVIRNNIIWHADLGSDFGDVGIECESAPGARILHNTVYLMHDAPGGIAVRFASSTGVEVANNLVRVPGGVPALWLRDGASAASTGNVLNASSAMFRDAANGDLHLVETPVPGVTDAAAAISGAPADDFDGDGRPNGAAPDVGADEMAAASALVASTWARVKEQFRQR